MIDKIDKSINRLSDMDWMWWPFLSSRPAKKDIINNFSVFKSTALCGTFVAVTTTIFIMILTRDRTILWVAFWTCMGIAWPLFFVMKLPVTMAWNRRAKHLRERKNR